MVNDLKINSYVVLPAHGIGKLANKVTESINGVDVVCYEVYFEIPKMSVFLPISKLQKQGLRLPIARDEIDRVWSILKTESRGMRVVWSKRSREYSKKLLTGGINDIAEVVRDLFPNAENPNRSYSERTIYEDGLQRIASELAIVLNVPSDEAEAKVLDILSKYHEVYRDSLSYNENIEEDYEMEQIPSNM